MKVFKATQLGISQQVGRLPPSLPTPPFFWFGIIFREGEAGGF